MTLIKHRVTDPVVQKAVSDHDVGAMIGELSVT